MEADLHEALRARYGPDPSPKMLHHLEFAMTSRERGHHALDEIERRLGPIRGLKVLDVGCAYAGFVIAAAERGASAWGVEISRKLWDLGMRNARGEDLDVNLIPGDFLSGRVAEVLPRDFDLVIVNDVFEQVYDTAGLLAQLSRLMSDNALFMFSIPDGDAVSFVESEGHYRKPGLTLLAPNWWSAMIPSFTAFYRPWSYYSGLFRAFGFSAISRWGVRELSAAEAQKELLDGVVAAGDAIASATPLDERVIPALTAGFDEYQAQVRHDLDRLELGDLVWRYLTRFWRGVARKTGKPIADLEKPRPAPRRERLEPIAVDLSAPPEHYRSPWNIGAEHALEPSATGLRCWVSGVADTGTGQYGGVGFAVEVAGPIELDLELLDPDNVEAVYVDGENPQRCRVLRWRWDREEAGAAAHQRVRLTPGKTTGPFVASGVCYPSLVSRLHVFIRVAPKKRAGFVIRKLAL